MEPSATIIFAVLAPSSSLNNTTKKEPLVELTLASIMVDVSLSVAGWLHQAAVSKKDRKTIELVTTLQGFGSGGFTAEWTGPALLAAMQGRMTIPLARKVMDTESFSGLAKEIFLCEMTGASEAKKESSKNSLRILFRKLLADEVKKDHLRKFSDFIYSSIRDTSATWIEQLRNKHPEALTAISTMVTNRRIHATLEAIENHLYLSRRYDRGSDKEEWEIWKDKYSRQVVNAHGFIQPPDFNNSRRISIDDLYVGPKFIEQSTESQTEYDYQSMLRRIDRTVILGDPGGGKSTFSAVLATYLAKESASQQIPFHVTLRDYAKYHDDISILGYINKELATKYQCEAPKQAIEYLLISGEAVVIFDGLDELIDNSKRRTITSKVEAFSLEYPLSKILVTSRRIGYAEAKLDPATFTNYVIGEFEESEVRSFVEKWFRSQGEEDFSGVNPETLAESFMAQSEAVPDLRKNPLMLSLMCIIFKGENFIPRSRPEVYARCANLLFEKWDGHRSIEVPLRAKDHIDPAMKFFAYWMLTSKQAESGVPFSVLVDKMTEYLHPRAFSNLDEAKRASEEFINFCKGRAWVFSDAGTTPSGESLWTFTHRTFMEYFAAAHLNRMYDTPEKLARELLPRVAAQEWDVIAQLAVQIANEKEQGSERALGVMLRDRVRRTSANRQNILSFITRCLDFAVVSEQFVEQLADSCFGVVETVDEYEVETWLSYPGSPLWSLLHNGLRYMTPIEQSLARLLPEYLASEETGKQIKAASIVLWCSYTFAAPGDIFSRSFDANHARWGKFFDQVLFSHLDKVQEAAEHKLSLHIFLMIANVEDIEAAYEKALSDGVEPAYLLFNSGTFWWHAAPTSLSNFIVRRALAFRGPDPTIELERVSDFFLRAVEAALSSGPLEVPKLGLGGAFFSPTVDNLPKYVLRSRKILDCFVLVMLGMYENMQAAGVSMEPLAAVSDPWRVLYEARAGNATGSTAPPWFIENISDDWLKEFVVAWAKGEKSLFQYRTGVAI